jgi:hypothetical protein
MHCVLGGGTPQGTSAFRARKRLAANAWLGTPIVGQRLGSFRVEFALENALRAQLLPIDASQNALKAGTRASEVDFFPLANLAVTN